MDTAASSCFIYVLLMVNFGGEAKAVGNAALERQEWADRIRYAVGQQADDNRMRMTAILPDTPFIQLRNGAEGSGGRVSSVNGSKSNPKLVRLRPGQSAVLHCEVLGMPSPVAYWTKNGRPVPAATTVKAAADTQQPTNLVEMMKNDGRPTLEHAVTVAKLKVTCASGADEGVYECNGDNGVEKVTAYTKVVVDTEEADPTEEVIDCENRPRLAPNIYMYTEMRLEYPGNNAQLICRADGQPRPTVRWFNSDETPIKNGENFTILSNGDLLVKNINFGVRQPFRQFSCQASSPIGKDVAVIDLLTISRSK